MKTTGVKKIRIIALATIVGIAAGMVRARDVVYDLNGQTVSGSFNSGGAIADDNYYVHGPGTFVSSSRLFKNGANNIIQFDGGAIVQLTTNKGALDGLMVAGNLNYQITLSNCTIVSRFNSATALSRDVGLYLADPVVGTTFSTVSASGTAIQVRTKPTTQTGSVKITGPGKMNIFGCGNYSSGGAFYFELPASGKSSTFDYSGETTVSNANAVVSTSIPNSHFTIETTGSIDLSGVNLIPQGITLKNKARMNFNSNTTATKVDVRAGAEFAFKVNSGKPVVMTATNSTWPTTPHSVFIRLTAVPGDGESLLISGVGETSAEVFYPEYDPYSNARITFTVRNGNLYAVVTRPDRMVINLNGWTQAGFFSPNDTGDALLDRPWEIHGPGVFDSGSRLYPNDVNHTVTIDDGAEVRLTTSKGASDGLIVSATAACTVSLGACTLVSKFNTATCLARNIRLAVTDSETGTTISTTSASGVPIVMHTQVNPATQTVTVMGSGNLNIAGEGTFRFDPQTVFTYTGTTTVRSNATAILNTTVANSTFVVEGGARLKAGVDPAAIGGLAPQAGARLSFDISGTAAPYRLTPASVTAPATGTAIIDLSISSEPADGRYPLIANVTAAQLSKFALSTTLVGSKHLSLAVDNGWLTLVVSLTDASKVTWTGAGLNRLWSSAANWENNLLPQGNVDVTFGVDAGTGATVNDLSSLAFGTLTFLATAPESVHTGVEALGVKTAITNHSAAVQTLDLPLNFGTADDLSAPFTVVVTEAQGLVTMTGDVRTISEAFVKTGAGTSVIADTAIQSPRTVTVEEGVLKIGRWAKAFADWKDLSASAAGAELRFDVNAGAQFDFAFEPRLYDAKEQKNLCARTFFIAGAGPDGRGAVIDSGTAGLADDGISRVGIFRLVLTGDAKLGGGGISIRNGVIGNDKVRIEGPYTLTTDCSSRGLECSGTEFALGKLVNEGRLFLVRGISGTVTNGVCLVDRSRLHLYAANIPAGIPFVAEKNATGTATVTVTSASEISYLKGAITVQPQVTVNFDGIAYSCVFEGAVTNDGTMAYVSGAGSLKFAGTLSGHGALVGSQIIFREPTAGFRPIWQMAADENGFTEKIDISGVTNPDFLLNLRRIEVRYAGTAGNRVFEIGPAGNLTARAASLIELAVTDAQGTALKNCHLAVTDGKFMLHICDDRFPVIATWTGAKDGNVADPANWACLNELGEPVEGVTPLDYTSVRFTANTTFSCPAGTPFTCRELVVGGTTLGADCDWSGIDFSLIVPEGNGTIDLKGHNLTLSITENLARHVIVTDSSADGEGGELHVTVPQGKAPFSNGSSGKWLELNGSLKFVKDGPGRFVVLGNNGYTGGTLVAAGELWTYNDTTSSTYAFRDETGRRWKHLGAFDSTVTVNQDAKLDIRGLYLFAHYKLVLNGGTFAASRYKHIGDNTLQGLGGLTLTADSRCEITQPTIFRDFGDAMGCANLGGHTLTIDMTQTPSSSEQPLADDRGVWLSPYGFTNGTVVVNGLADSKGGQLLVRTEVCDLRNSTLDLNCRLNLQQDLLVGDLITHYTANLCDGADAYKVRIFGRYTPVSDYIHAFEMQNGSTIDLSAKTAVWNATSALTERTLGFAANARVMIDTGARKFRDGERVVEWAAGTEPANIATVRFASVGGHGGFVRKGHAIVFVNGFAVFVR